MKGSITVKSAAEEVIRLADAHNTDYHSIDDKLSDDIGYEVGSGNVAGEVLPQNRTSRRSSGVAMINL